jgi:hypothetical protein
MLKATHYPVVSIRLSIYPCRSFFFLAANKKIYLSKPKSCFTSGNKMKYNLMPLRFIEKSGKNLF